MTENDPRSKDRPRRFAILLLGTLSALAGPVAAQTAPAHDLVWGRVLDAALHPIAGAAVTVARRGADTTTTGATVHPRTRTDAAGRFGLGRDAFSATQAGDAILIAHRGATSLRVAVTADSADLGDLVLGPATALRGRVRRPDGQPLPDALVVATDGSSAGTAVAFASTTTGEDGVFELPGAVTQGARLVVSRAGFGAATVGPLWPGSALDITLHPTGSLRGRLLDVEGDPMADALVHVLHEDGRANTYTLTDADGRFEVELGTRTRRRLEAFGQFGSGMLCQATDWLGHRDTELNLRFSRRDPPLDQPMLAGLDAKVVDHRGMPLADFEAAALWIDGTVARREGDGTLLMDWDRCARQGRGGEVRLAGPHPSEAKRGTVVVRAPGFAEARKPGVRAGGSPVTLALSPESTLVGVVVDATGRPVARATVWAEVPAPAGAPPRTVPPPHRRTRTDRLGRFELVGLTAGAQAVHAQRDEHDEPTVEVVRLGSGEHRADARLTLAAVPTVHGRVLNLPADVALRVQLVGSLGGAFPLVPCESAVVELDTNGHFEMPAPRAAKYSVELLWPRPPQGGPALRVAVGRVDLDGGAATFEVDAAGSLPGVVRGRVRCTRGGMPPERLLVVAEPPGTGEATTAFFDLVGARGAVGADGTFAVQTPPGPVRLVLIDAESGVVFAWTAGVMVPSSGEIEQDLAFEAARLRLLPATDGGGATPACRVELRPPDGLYPAGVGRLAPRINLHSGQGIDLPERADPRTVWVPPAPIQVRLHPTHDGARQSHLPTRPLGSVEVTADPTHEIEVRLRIPRR